MGPNQLSGTARRDLRLTQVFLFMLFTGIAVLACLADRAPLDLESIYPDLGISQKFVYYWQGVVYRFFPGPYVYRVLIPYTYWALNNATHLSLLAIDLFVKILLLIACQYSLYRYLSGFFERTTALLGVFIFDSLLGYLLSFIKGPSMIETIDLMNFLVITLGLIWIYEKKFLSLSIILFIGLLNRETPLILIPVAFLYEWIGNKNIRGSSFVFFISVLTFVGIRIFLSSWAGSTWFNIDELKRNLPFLFGMASREGVIANLRLAILAGPFILLGLYKFGEHPRFLKIAACGAPILILIHYFVGAIIEARLWIPLFPFLIPLVVNNLAKLSGKPVN